MATATTTKLQKDVNAAIDKNGLVATQPYQTIRLRGRVSYEDQVIDLSDRQFYVLSSDTPYFVSDDDFDDHDNGWEPTGWATEIHGCYVAPSADFLAKLREKQEEEEFRKCLAQREREITRQTTYLGPCGYVDYLAFCDVYTTDDRYYLIAKDGLFGERRAIRVHRRMNLYFEELAPQLWAQLGKVETPPELARYKAKELWDLVFDPSYWESQEYKAKHVAHLSKNYKAGDSIALEICREANITVTATIERVERRGTNERIYYTWGGK